MTLVDNTADFNLTVSRNLSLQEKPSESKNSKYHNADRKNILNFEVEGAKVNRGFYLMDKAGIIE